MKLKLSSLFPQTANPPWTAVDAGVRGTLLLATVMGSREPGAKPRVLQLGKSGQQGWEPAALKSLLEERKSRSGNTVAVLPRGDYQLVLLPRPPVPVDEIERSVRWAMASQVDFNVDEAVLVHMEIPPAGVEGAKAQASPAADEQQSLYVVAARSEVVQSVAQAFKAADQRLDAVDVRETAQRNIAALVESPDECLCLLRVTTEGIQLTFTHRGELYLDRYIAQSLEALQLGDEFERQRLIERIVQQILVSVSHLQSHHAGLSVKRVVLCPLPMPLDIEASLREQLSLPVEVLDLASMFDLTAVPQLQASAEQALYFCALGAALRGHGARP